MAVSAKSQFVRPRMYFADTSHGRPFAKDPSVVRLGNRYLMYYSISSSATAAPVWSVGVAVSFNLLDWEKIGEIEFKDGVEARGFCAPCAIVLDSQVHLFYQTYGGGPRDAICHAVSRDGIQFARSDNPVFSPKGAWTIGRAIDAEVVRFQGRLLMYWATRDPAFKRQMVGVSTIDPAKGFHRDAWTQLSTKGPILMPSQPTELDDPHLDLAWERDCIEAASAAVRGDRIYLFYAGAYNNEPQQIGVAVSNDGIHYRRLLNGQPLVRAGMPGSWNDRESGHPCYFQDQNGSCWLFYQGNNREDAQRFQTDTWYLSVLHVDWQAVDGMEIPRVREVL